MNGEHRGREVVVIDRRSEPRVALEVEVGWESENNFYTGLIQDISSGGVFLATHQLLPIGTHVTLKLRLPGIAAPMVAEAKVRWVRDPGRMRTDAASGMGLQFVALSPVARGTIHAFLKQRDSIFYDDE